MKKTKKLIISLLLIICMIITCIMPAQATNKEKKCSPFKSFKIGKVDLTKEVNKNCYIYNYDDEDEDEEFDDSKWEIIRVKKSKLKKIKKGDKVKIKMKKGFKVRMSVGYLDKKKKKEYGQSLKNGSKMKAGFSYFDSFFVRVKKGSWENERFLKWWK